MTDTLRESKLSPIEMQERLLELELALSTGGWVQFQWDNQNEFSRDGIHKITQLARLNYIKNPLIKRGVDVQTYYVFGRSINISAKDELINEVVQHFLNDENNKHELTSQQARKARDKELRVDGNLFFALFSQPQTGNVRVGTILTDEIKDVIRNPENRNDVWYYLRQWSVEEFDLDAGTMKQVTYKRYYCDLHNRDMKRAAIGPIPVDQTCVVYHVKVGGFSDWKFGVSEVYAALDWARAYKGFLEDFAKIIKSLARFAWNRKTSGGARGVTAAVAKIGSTFGNNGIGLETNPSPVAGATNVSSGDGESLDPIRTAGSTTPADDGKPLRIMSGIAMGLPDSIASGDVDQGSRATAKTLDRPTEFQFIDRQELWVGIFTTLLDYHILNNVLAPEGALRGLGSPQTNEYDEVVVLWPDSVDSTLLIDFPPILEQDVLQSMNALVAAAQFIPDQKFLAREAMIILGIDDVDVLLEPMFPDGYDQVQDPAMIPVVEALRELKEALLTKS